MVRVKLLLRIGGITSLLVGLLCFPFGRGSNDPVRALSVFSSLADSGILVKLGFLLFVLGAIALVASWLVPGEESDDPL